ncbi:MAG: hypothetical protein ACRKGH_00595 [Dehalogenimonas sp.]
MKIKSFSRLAVVTVASLSLMLLSPIPAAAAWAWCSADPVIIIDGHQVTLEGFVGGEEDIVAQALKGNTWFKVYVPKGVDTEIVSTETKVKVHIFEDKNLVIDENGVVPFTVVLSVNAPQQDFPMVLEMTVNGVTYSTDGDDFTTNDLTAYFELP